MKKKLLIITGSILTMLLVVGVVLFFVLKNKITVTFDSDGGTEISPLKLNKGEKIALPVSKKEGYVLEGWYYEDEKLYDGVWFTKDVVLKANWVKEEVETMTITFDTNGGNKLSSITRECKSKLKLPTPTKSGYTFAGWYDDESLLITNNTKLVCKNITLKAKWNKIETPSKEALKEYTCPDGYKLEGAKCTIEEKVKERCPEGTTVISGGLCVTLTNSARRDYSRACPKEHITYVSFAGEVEGKVVNWGVWGCAYYKTSDNSKSECESHGFKWVTPENACYVKWTSNSTINSCDHLSGYVNVSNPNSYLTNTGINPGCFPVHSKETYCNYSYEKKGVLCIKTIDATLKNN